MIFRLASILQRVRRGSGGRRAHTTARARVAAQQRAVCEAELTCAHHKYAWFCKSGFRWGTIARAVDDADAAAELEQFHAAAHIVRVRRSVSGLRQKLQ